MYISKTHSVPGYLQLRYNEATALSAESLRSDDHPDVLSRIICNMPWRW